MGLQSWIIYTLALIAEIIWNSRVYHFELEYIVPELLLFVRLSNPFSLMKAEKFVRFAHVKT